MELYGYSFLREEDLMHFGIKGQKWGVRRFQNEDRTWTAAGKERYGDGSSDVKTARQAYKQAKRDYNKSFNDAYRHNHPFSFNKKKREESNARWEEAGKKAEALRKAKNEYKDVKKASKADNGSKLKTAAKIGATVAGTALAAYGAYKMNQALNGEIGRHYKELGNQWYEKAGKALVRAEGYANGGYHNSNTSSIRNTSGGFERAMAKESFARAKEYATKSRQGSYSTREKIDAVKRMVSHR